MIYGELLGGLGNCMFIIANLFAIAKENNDTFVVNKKISSCTKRPLNEKRWLETIFNEVEQVDSRPREIRKLFRERGFEYSPVVYVPGIQYQGYFQSEKYFKKYRKEIIELFCAFKNKRKNYLKRKLSTASIASTSGTGGTISIHYRRGDYLKFPDVHVNQDHDYYENALFTIAQKLGFGSILELNEEYTFCLFSDDIEYCKSLKFYKKFKNKKFIRDHDVEEMYMMSMCDHNIINNSTFSWWGSWLNENENKIVIAPAKWFGAKGPQNWKDIYTEEMIII